MKKILTLLTVLTFAVFTSCSSDDDNGENQAIIVGSWEYSQEGTVIDGEEVLEPYDHGAPECGNDFVEFQANGTAVETSFFANMVSECETETFTFSYVVNGQQITLDGIDDEAVNAEILTLNSTTLKIRTSEEIGGETFVYIIVLTRI